MSVVLQPLGDRVLVNLLPLPETTGLIIRVSRQEYARKAQVVAAGPECVDIREGMTVLVSSLVGQEVGDDIIMPEGSVLAICEEP